MRKIIGGAFWHLFATCSPLYIHKVHLKFINIGHFDTGYLDLFHKISTDYGLNRTKRENVNYKFKIVSVLVIFFVSFY